MTISKEPNGPDHSKALAETNRRAEALWAKGDQKAALALFEEVLEQSIAILGPRDPDTTSAAWNLFFTLRQSNEQDAARQVLTDHLLWLVSESESLEDPRQIQVQNMLQKMAEKGEAEQNQTVPDLKPALERMDVGDWAGAKTLWESYLIEMVDTLDAKHPDVTYVAWHLFVCLDKLEAYDQAREILRDHLLWLLEADEDDLDEFLKPMREEVIKITSTDQTRALADDVTPLLQQAMELMNAGDWSGARAVWQPLFETLAEKLPARHPDTTVAAFYLFVCLHHLKQAELAENILESHLIWLVNADTPQLDDRLTSIREQVVKIMGR